MSILPAISALAALKSQQNGDDYDFGGYDTSTHIARRLLTSIWKLRYWLCAVLALAMIIVAAIKACDR